MLNGHEFSYLDSGEGPAVMFIHGLWLLPHSWQPWRDLFENNGYTTLAPGWPNDPTTVSVSPLDNLGKPAKLP